MSSATEWPVPGPGSVFIFWLASIGIGSGMLFLQAIFVRYSSGNPLLYSGVIGAIAAVLSLPSLLGMLFLIPWALGSSLVIVRWLRLFTVQSISFGITVWLAHLADNRESASALQFGSCYLVAGLLAAYWRYRAWLK